MKEEQINQFNKDILISMDRSYKELKLKLKPVFNNKTKYINGKLLKDCFKYITEIIQCHQHLRSQIKNG